MYYRKRPVVVEAMQFTSNNEPDDWNMNEIVKWIRINGGRAAHNRTEILIDTLEGVMRASVGDFIIKGVKGEFYPCKPYIFVETYEQMVE
jgi:hypothetical protein